MRNQETSALVPPSIAAPKAAAKKKILVLYTQVLVGFVAVLTSNTSRDQSVLFMTLVSLLALQALALRNGISSLVERLTYAACLLLVCAACFIAPMATGFSTKIPEATLLSAVAVMPFLLWLGLEFAKYRKAQAAPALTT